MTTPFTGVLETSGGQVFCKAAPHGGFAARSNAIEAAVNAGLPRYLVPGVRWQIEAAGWSLVGFEYRRGRHPSLEPGAVDLDVVVDTVASLARLLTPAPPTRLRSLAQRWGIGGGWGGLADRGPLDPWAQDNVQLLDKWAALAPEAVQGETLTHTDLNAQNILIHDAAERPVSLSMVDWAWPAPAAAWCDAAFLVPQLIAWGHPPADAEAVMREVPAFAAAEPDALTAFAAAAAAVGERQRVDAPDVAALRRISWSRLTWFRFRIGSI